MTATGYQPSEQRPCARGWVHTCQFEFDSLRQSVLVFGILQRNERKIAAFAGLREILP